MSRHRLAVALLAPPAEAEAIDVLRAALGVPEPFGVPPHVTLVPPTNVAGAEVSVVLDVLRRVAAGGRPLTLDIGPATTFAPETPTVHLGVTGSDMDALRSLRGGLRAGPLDRPDVWPFQPHVTLLEHAATELIDAAIVSLAGVRQQWSVPAVHLLEQRRNPPEHPQHGQAFWVPIREEPLGGPTVVGRGGVELHLRALGMLDDAVGALCGMPTSTPATVAGTPRPLVVSAAAALVPDAPLGAAVGTRPTGPAAVLDRVVVCEGHRGMGIGAQLLAAWCAEAAAAGADLVVAERHDPFLVRHGFVPVGDLAVRRL